MSDNEKITNKNELIIDVRSLLNRSVQKESEFESSYMRNIYLQAFQLVQAIVSIDSEKTFEHSIFRSERHNIIAFTGRRGTGKTSAMVSVANILQNADILKNNQIKSAKFYSLANHIDASMFVKGDNLLRSILSEMYSDMKSHQQQNASFSEDARFRKLKSQFIEVLKAYNSVVQISSSHNNPENELEAQTDHLGIKNKMEELVQQYLSYMLEESNHADRRLYPDLVNRSYLVICIDDIDMAKGMQSEIINAIHLYLMIPNVIVLMTADFRNLQLALQKDFYNSLIFGRNDSEAPQNFAIASEKQALNYLQKIVPSDMRITMPSWKKLDYRDLYPCKIDTEHYTELERLKGCADQPKASMSPKEFIFFLLAKRTQCLLDLDGHKPHFMEPDSLRDLYDKFYLLYNMKNISVEENLRAERLKINRKVLLDYLYFKMEPELKLSPSEREFSKDFLALPMERRGKRLWEYYYSRLHEAETAKRVINRWGDIFYYDELSLEKDRYFCMGEVFRILFTASRIGVFSKDFVKFLLASYSFTMPQYIDNLLADITDDFDKNAYEDSASKLVRKILYNQSDTIKRFNDVFGYSLLGSWSIRNRIRKTSVGQLQITVPDFLSFFSSELKKKDNNVEEIINDLALLSLLNTDSFTGQEAIAFDLVQKSITIHHLDPGALPLNFVRLQGGGLFLGFEKNGSPFNIWAISASESGSKAFDTIKLVNEERFKEKQLQKKTNLSKKEFDTLYKIVLLFHKSYSNLLKRFSGNTVPLCLMLKNIDMSYNILKRNMIEMQYLSADNPAVFKDSMNPDEYLLNCLDDMRARLNKQMQKYNDKNTKEIDISVLRKVYEAIMNLKSRIPEPYLQWAWVDDSVPAQESDSDAASEDDETHTVAATGTDKGTESKPQAPKSTSKRSQNTKKQKSDTTVVPSEEPTPDDEDGTPS